MGIGIGRLRYVPHFGFAWVLQSDHSGHLLVQLDAFQVIFLLSPIVGTLWCGAYLLLRIAGWW
jgi:hypothetical protein